LFWSVVGYIRIKLTGENIYNFFDECKKQNIRLKNLCCIPDGYCVEVMSAYLKKLLPIAKKYDVNLGIEGRFGLAMKFFIYKNRIAFAVSAALFALLISLNSFFVNNISISGNVYHTQDQIKTILREHGIYKGKFIPFVNPEKTKEKILYSYPGLSWIWINIKGTTAFVDVREKVSKPEFFDKEYPCNIVAKRDGVVIEAISEMGTTYAEVGSYVKKGELLIGGIYDSTEYSPIRLVHAAGRVRARTTYEMSVTFSLSSAGYTLSEKTKNSYGIRFFGNAWEICAPKGKDWVKLSENEKNFSIFGKIYLPLGFTNKKYCEIIRTECIMDKSDAIKAASKELRERLNVCLPQDAQIVDTKETLTENSDGTLTLVATFECVEDIAQELLIELSE